MLEVGDPCPLCKKRVLYVGFNSAECCNPACVNYQDAEVTRRRRARIKEALIPKIKRDKKPRQKPPQSPFGRFTPLTDDDPS